MSKPKRLSFQFLGGQKRKELEEMFNSVDKDHDNKISTNEFCEMLGSAGMDRKSMDAMLNTVQTDKDGNMDFDSFAKIMRPTLKTPLRMTSKQQELLETFKVFDKDGDGVINAEELTAMMQQLGDKISLEEAKQLISDVDDNHDGVVGFDEFAKMMGVRPPESPMSPRTSKDSARSIEALPCNHRHHRFSLRRFFCKQQH
ncbi:hypothetical protein BJ944DRAFT_244768 [Cunninghamella echinulata]|nr:hypothetical protein BJ944DRAFT_244768 [Cunninghamella echinulata]